MARPEERCNFCGKTRDKVRRLVAGPGVFICDECVRLCSQALNELPPEPPEAAGAKPRWWRRLLRFGAAAPA